MADEQIVAAPAGADVIIAPKWYEVLLKSWAVWVAGLGLAVPELADLLLQNLDRLPLTDTAKMWMRMGALALVIIVRPIPQRSLRKEASPVYHQP